jgi:hypothetical protein
MVKEETAKKSVAHFAGSEEKYMNTPVKEFGLMKINEF